VISHWDDARTWRGERGHIAGSWSSLTGRASDAVGVKRIRIDPGMWSTPLHLEGAEEEILVVLEGDGHLLLWEPDGVVEHPVRAGSVVARPPGTGVAHAFLAGERGLTPLLHGTRGPNDICFYPRSGKVFFRGVGVIARLGEPLDYWDGED
jgi:uncharacterized cupin superfamily protein